MKRVLTLTLLMLALIPTISGQKWTKTIYKADELLDTSPYIEYAYDDKNVLCLVNTDTDGTFSNIVLCNYNTEYKNQEEIMFLVGKYDTLDNLQTKFKVKGKLSPSDKHIVLMYEYNDNVNVKVYEDLMRYLLYHDGYVRFVSNDVKNGVMDVKIPCYK